MSKRKLIANCLCNRALLLRPTRSIVCKIRAQDIDRLTAAKPAFLLHSLPVFYKST